MNKYVLDYRGMGITRWEDIEADPNYNTATVLLASRNKLKDLDGYFLPPNLQVLDLDNNEISQVRRLDDFPRTLNVLWIENNKLTKLPKFPAHIQLNDYRFSGNPIKVPSRDFIETETAASNTKAIRWYTTDGHAASVFEDEERQLYNVRSGDPDFFDELKTNVLKSLNRDKLCRMKIGDGYIRATIDKIDHMIMEIYKGEIVAFALIEFKSGNTELYIHLICADPANKGGGGRIIDMLKKYFKEHPSLNRVTLESVPEAHGFYLKKGFRSCISGQMCPMEMVRSSNKNTTRRNTNLRNVLGSVSGGGGRGLQ